MNPKLLHKKFAQKARAKRKMRIRRKLSGTTEKPRLTVFKSARHIYAQVIDDISGRTLVSASTLEKDYVRPEGKGKVTDAKAVGARLAQKAKAAGIAKVVFDRNGFLYHGRIKALADGAREAGLKL